MKDDRERLRHILDAIEQTEKYSVQGEEAFRQSDLLQNWMVRHIQVIGEAARALSPQLRNRHPEIPWADIIGMRHVLVHDYFEIDLNLVWLVVSRDLSSLKREIEAILKEIEKPNEE